MDLEQARSNMIEQQIRTWDVLDQRILETLARVKREDFVPVNFRELAFADMNIPLGDGEVMMQPKVEARLLQALDPRPGERVLEVGTGSGHLTALLASLAGEVYSVEINPTFAESARHKLAAGGWSNVTVEVGDASRGWPQHEPYDAIVLTGSVAAIGDAFRRSLAPGGRLVAIVGRPPVMEAVLLQRMHGDGWYRRSLFDTSLPPLRNAEPEPAFVF